MSIFNLGEHVVVTDSVDDHYNGKSGVIVDDEYRNYISEHVYVVKLEDGYEMEFTADELTAEEDYV